MHYQEAHNNAHQEEREGSRKGWGKKALRVRHEFLDLSSKEYIEHIQEFVLGEWRESSAPAGTLVETVRAGMI